MWLLSRLVNVFVCSSKEKTREERGFEECCPERDEGMMEECIIGSGDV